MTAADKTMSMEKRRLAAGLTLWDLHLLTGIHAWSLWRIEQFGWDVTAEERQKIEDALKGVEASDER